MRDHPTRQERLVQAQIDHPAGRQYYGPHGDDHRIGHTGSDRDAVPGDSPVMEVSGLFLMLVGGIGLIALCAVVGGHAFGVAGIVIGLILGSVTIASFVRSLS